MLSRRFIERLKLSATPAYRIAIAAGVSPTQLSKWVIGAQPVRVRDPRLIRIGELLGLKPNEIFVEEDDRKLIRNRQEAAEVR